MPTHQTRVFDFEAERIAAHERARLQRIERKLDEAIGRIELLEQRLAITDDHLVSMLMAHKTTAAGPV